MPAFNNLAGKELSIYLFDGKLLASLIGIAGVAIALLDSVSNLIAYKSNRGKTEYLTQLTNELRQNVHRITTYLNQRISRLERIHHLVTGLTQVIRILRQDSRSHAVRGCFVILVV